jgi:hypothetical protein
MNSKQAFPEYIRVLKNLERRLKTVERRQKDMDEKLDHIIFRLIVDETKPARVDDNNDCRYDRNEYSHFKDI